MSKAFANNAASYLGLATVLWSLGIEPTLGLIVGCGITGLVLALIAATIEVAMRGGKG